MNENPHAHSDEITLKELILKIKEYIREVIKFWWLMGLICILCVSGFIYIHYNHIPTYKSELRFVVEGQSDRGGLGSILGSFGIQKGGKVNPFRVIEVGKSTDLLLRVLSNKGESGDNIANNLLNTYALSKKWEESNSRFSNFWFEELVTTSASEVQRSAIKRLRTKIWGNKKVKPMTELSLNDNTGIYSLSTEAVTEELSLAITNSLYEEIKQFFEEEVFLNQKQLADIITMKADSIKILSESNIMQLAKFEDSNRGFVNNQSMVKKRILLQESMALSATYAEIMKNKEMTDVNLKDMQPLFMAIDTPFSPIVPISSSMVVAIIKGLILGGFFSILLIFIRKIYRDVMSN
jgi:hypothetical protein